MLDTRNIYEHSIGSFKNATKVSTNSFREFPQWVENNLTDKDKKIAMYCTEVYDVKKHQHSLRIMDLIKSIS